MTIDLSLFDAPARARLIHFFGLDGETSRRWRHVRRARLNHLRHRAPLRVGLSAIAILILCMIGQDGRLGGQMAGWAIAACVMALVPNLPHFARIGRSARLYSRSEAALALGTGLLWAAGIIGAATGRAEAEILGLALIVLFWMVAMAANLVAVPLAAIALLLPAGTGVAIMFWQNGLGFAAAASSAISVTLILMCMSHARSLLLGHLDAADLEEARDMLGLVLREFDETGGNWLWEIDAARSLKNVSARFADALGQPVDALEGRPLLPVLAGSAAESGKLSDGLQELVEKLRKRERFSGLLLPFERDGETRWWELSALPCTDAAGAFSGFRGLGCDVTEAHRAVDRINRMAKFDALTGLPNRVHLLEVLEQSIVDASRRRGRCVVMLIDLDRFKAVNDTFGHPVGDQLLTQVAARLRSIATDNEVFGRLGGDEFAAVVHDARDPAQIASFAQQIVETLSAPYEVNRYRLVIGASVGAAFSPRDGRTADMLLRSADLALYQSKEQGGGSYHAYEPRFLAEAEERRLIEIAFQTALEANEFSVVYQPVLDTSRDQVVNLEAELRWTSATLGEVAPDRFMPVAQDSRLIVPIGEWKLKTACMEATQWQDGLGLTVRITAEQLTDSGLAMAVMQALAQSGLAAPRLTIDMTEEALQKAGEQGLTMLEQLSALGVRLSLSGFGLGAAALSHFSRTRFSTVRLHPDLIRDASEDGRQSVAMLRAVLTLAENLGMAAAAQGIVDEAQYQTARSLGCKLMQGSLFGPPIPAGRVNARLLTGGGDRAVA